LAGLDTVFKDMTDGDLIQAILTGLDQARLTGGEGFIAQLLALVGDNDLLGLELLADAGNEDIRGGGQGGKGGWFDPVRLGQSDFGQVEGLLNGATGRERDGQRGTVHDHIYGNIGGL